MTGKLDFVKLSSGPATGRLARCIRESEAGWLFYSPTGSAYHIFKEEAERFEQAGLEEIEKIDRIAIKSRMIHRVMIVGGFPYIFLAVFLMPWMPWLTGEMISFSATCMMVAGILIAMLHPLLAMMFRSTAMIVWQASTARKLKRDGRGGVPEDVSQHHLRYNLFRLIFHGALVLLITRFAIYFFLPVSHFRENFGIVDLVLIGILFWACIPAFLIDHTHRRRKWLD